MHYFYTTFAECILRNQHSQKIFEISHFMFFCTEIAFLTERDILYIHTDRTDRTEIALVLNRFAIGGRGEKKQKISK